MTPISVLENKGCTFGKTPILLSLVSGLGKDSFQTGHLRQKAPADQSRKNWNTFRNRGRNSNRENGIDIIFPFLGGLAAVTEKDR